MFMLASNALRIKFRTVAGATRVGNESVGIQFAPLMKIGTLFTRK